MAVAEDSVSATKERAEKTEVKDGLKERDDGELDEL